MSEKKNVLIAMSGGVDSSVTAALLLEQGWHCQGAFIITHDRAEAAKNDAQAIADKLGIKLHVLDWRERFEKVWDYFCGEYKKARTPNPCVYCNRNIKFAGIYEYAQQIGAEYIATGHYTKVIDGGLYQAENLAKDQSYALCMINKSVLDHLILPLGQSKKEHTRKIAKNLGLFVHDKPDSQEICFIPDGDYAAKLEERCPELVRDGQVVDSQGKVLGEHKGVHNFTIGQRRGLGIAMGVPYYVVSLDAKTNEVLLGQKEELMHKKLLAKNVNFLCQADDQFEALIKIRYNHKGATGVVKKQGNDVIIEFDEPIASVTPGQAAVFYCTDTNGSRLIGGGWIEKAV
jgi:tRNA-uridine 2-sulfurtransferase